MNDHTTQPAPAAPAARRTDRRRRPGAGPTPPQVRPPAQRQHPVLDQLAQLYPALFGEQLKPLKRGIFQELLDAQPGVLEAESLKAALALHTRSSRYLTVVASGQQRHDLAGVPVEALTPEQVHHALVEVFRRRQSRTPEDLVPKLRQRIAQAFEASGLGEEAYATATQSRDEVVNEITRLALADVSGRMARDAALLRAFEASGQTVEAFADMYGMPVQEAQRTLDRARARLAPKP
jgi:ProP effector